MVGIARMFIDEERALLDSTRKRLEGVIRQMSDDDVNWRPNDQSNSVTNLVLHICGNMGRFFFHFVGGEPDVRNRDAEFDPHARRTTSELLQMLADNFRKLDELLGRIPLATLYDEPVIDGKATTVCRIITTCSAHYTEHLGQIISTAKLRLGDKYQYLAYPPAAKTP